MKLAYILRSGPGLVPQFCMKKKLTEILKKTKRVGAIMLFNSVFIPILLIAANRYVKNSYKERKADNDT
jgi:hypothetical protein